MPSKGSKTATIRLYKDDLELIEEHMRRTGSSRSWSVHELLHGKEIPIEPWRRELEGMCRASSISLDDFLLDMTEKLSDGRLAIGRDGKVVACDLSGLESACAESGQKMEDVISQMEMLVESGMLG